MMMKNKSCIICNLTKNINDFYYRKDNKCYRLECKSCWLNIQKQYYLKHKKDRQKYYKTNKDDILIQKKLFYIKYRDKLLSQKKLYNKNHRKERTKYKRDRWYKDTNFRLSANMRTRIYAALKGKTKSLSTMFLIGCEIDYLLYHIQKQFKPNMSWDNYGRGFGNKGMEEWHIDHIKPCASFDLSKFKEQKKCFHYTNLQPLWAEENRKKINK